MLFLIFCLTHEEKEPEDEQGYYVSSVHIKNNSANPLDISYKEIGSNYAQQRTLPYITWGLIWDFKKGEGERTI